MSECQIFDLLDSRDFYHKFSLDRPLETLGARSKVKIVSGCFWAHLQVFKTICNNFYSLGILTCFKEFGEWRLLTDTTYYTIIRLHVHCIGAGRNWTQDCRRVRMDSQSHGRRNFKDTNPLMSFCLGWWSNLVGSASGQKQSVKFLQNMVYTAQFTPPPPQTHTVCINCTFSLGRGGGGRRSERR